MSSSNKLNFFIISAPSGAGKTSLVKALIEKTDGCRAAVSHTTRAKREGEIEGKDYHFVSETEFSRIQSRQGFLESAEVFGHSYGTSFEEAQRILDNGKTLILEIDWQGALQVRNKFAGAQSIFILPPSLEALRTRLKTRAQDSEEIVEKRMQQAIAESSKWTNFDFLIENNVFDLALESLSQIIHGNGEQFVREKQVIHLKDLITNLTN
ncbi:MAG: guanylate kinase [Gammaproteobacteria bacterium]|nr:guanylate kinase [Gammaproteobacteria bacterium]